eukprot:EG_transcript_34048
MQYHSPNSPAQKNAPNSIRPAAYLQRLQKLKGLFAAWWGRLLRAAPGWLSSGPLITREESGSRAAVPSGVTQLLFEIPLVGGGGASAFPTVVADLIRGLKGQNSPG